MKQTLLIAVVTLSASSSGLCQTAGTKSFWPNSTIPSTVEVTSDTSSVTLGLQFSSDVPGSVTGVRFYKGPHNTGSHVGTLWSKTGTKLAEVTFSGETSSGWQQANFSAPVSIAANTPYVMSYLAPNGNYADDQSYSWASLSAAPLHVSGSSPGVFAYGSAASFPNGTWNGSNYWIDPVFVPASGSNPQSTFWTNSSVPGTPEVTNDIKTVTLGLKFSSDVPGSVAGVRFYKGPDNTGQHIGTLWSGAGTKLAEVTFSGETASGWQQANFSTPVNISANTTYVISYLAPRGYYAINQSYSWASLSAAPLHVSGSAPGTFAYGSGTTFPNGTWKASNYWVDLVFIPAGATSSTYSISGKVSGSAATVTLSGTASASTTTDSSGNYSFSGLRTGAYTVTPSQSGYAFTPSSAAVSINGASIANVNFTASTSSTPTYSISGKVSGSAATLTLSGTASASATTDSAGNYTFSGLKNGPYTVTPSQPGSSFTPSSAPVSVNGAPIANVNFTATTTTTSHTVMLTWNSSTSPSINGYNLYRGTVSGGPYTKITESPITSTSYIDNGVTSGQTYFYVATTVASNLESSYSTEAVAQVPTP